MRSRRGALGRIARRETADEGLPRRPDLAQENDQLKRDMSLDAAKLQSKDGQAKLKAEVTMESLKAEYATRMAEMEKKHEATIMKLIADAQEQQREFKHEMALALVNARADAMKEANSHSHERNMQASDQLNRGNERQSALEKQKTEHKGEMGKMSETHNQQTLAIVTALSGLAESMKSLNQSISDSKPTAAKKIRNASGDMVAAEVSYQSGETRRIQVH